MTGLTGCLSSRDAANACRLGAVATRVRRAVLADGLSGFSLERFNSVSVSRKSFGLYSTSQSAIQRCFNAFGQKAFVLVADLEAKGDRDLQTVWDFVA